MSENLLRLNALIGEERNIVTDIAGTTRDTLNTRYNRFGYDFLLVDTAGLRKKAKVSEDVEFYSVMRSIRAIEESDVCILLIDATRGMEAQDLNIFHLIERNRKGVVIVVNKWDLVEKDGKTLIEYEKACVKNSSVQRCRYHLCFSPDQTTIIESIGGCPASICKPDSKINIGAQPDHA
jgi:GTPase_EngA: ribosome-associated GTPase EngA